MNDIESLKDYLIADEIQRLSSLSHEELLSEIIELKSRAIETAAPEELFKIKNYDD